MARAFGADHAEGVAVWIDPPLGHRRREHTITASARRSVLRVAKWAALAVLLATVWRWAASVYLFDSVYPDAEFVRTMIGRGANPNYRSLLLGDTMLTQSAWRWHGDVTEVLLRAGADPNAADRSGRTALMGAAWNNDTEVARLLLDAGANVRKTETEEGRAALHFACGRWEDRPRPPDLVLLLLKAGADPRLREADGSTPLHEAAAWGHVEIVRTLIEHGASPDAADRYRWTPLMFAAGRGHADCVRVLLEAGANPWAKEWRGRSAMSLAQEFGNSDVVAVVREAETRRRRGKTGGHAAP